MSKIDEIRSAMVAAMKAGEKEKKETLSMLLAALKNKQIDKRADLTEEEEIQVIMKEIKQTKETLEMTPADRTDIIEECNRRLTVLEAYAPKMMGEDEIKAIIEGVLSELGIENPTGKDKGNIMKHLMPKVKGKADGKTIGLFHTVKLTGTEVIADNRLYALGKALDGNYRKLHYALQDGHGSYIKVSAVNGKSAV